MARKFAEISYTPSVVSAQEHYTGRSSHHIHDEVEAPRDVLTDSEVTFIAARDGFYQGTVSQTGWPYVQFRGGPTGFLKALDDSTIAYADFQGNRQYLSIGNLNADDRISLILIDYPNRTRLKVWGRAKIVHHHEDPELLARLENPDYRAHVERAVVISIEALDWNCPRHITPRYTEAEILRMREMAKSKWAHGNERLAEHKKGD